ncbi:biofilm/acid-resistance regulator YmgB/AriR [Pantoea wallisii]
MDFHLQRLFFYLTDSIFTLTVMVIAPAVKQLVRLVMELRSLASTESQLSEYFKNAGAQYTSEKEVIAIIYKQLAAVKLRVSNKDIILALLERLESEHDVVQLDIYRQALELIVQRAPEETAP